MAERQITERGLEFRGAAEWWAYLGLHDGYYRDVDPYEEVHAVPFPWNKVGIECQECYLFGYFLGKEIKQSEEEEKKHKEALEEIRESVVRTGESLNRIDRLRSSME